MWKQIATGLSGAQDWLVDLSSVLRTFVPATIAVPIGAAVS